MHHNNKRAKQSGPHMDLTCAVAYVIKAHSFRLPNKDIVLHWSYYNTS